MTELDIEVSSRPRAQDDDEDIEMNDKSSDSWDPEILGSSPWHYIQPLTGTTGASAHNVDFLSTLDLTAPNATSTILHALFRPGSGFSPYTIDEALKGYIRAAWVPMPNYPDPLGDPNAQLREALQRPYPTLRARVGAIIGARLGEIPGGLPMVNGSGNNNPFGATVVGENGDSLRLAQLQQKQSEYFAALRRDWEGFLARCREIEKAGTWPVALGIVGLSQIRRSALGTREVGHSVILERERMGMIVKEDEPLSVFNQSQREMDEETEVDEIVSEDDSGPKKNAYSMVHLALSLKALFSPTSWSEVTNELYSAIRSNMSMTYSDLLLDLSQRVALEDLDESTSSWVIDRLEGIMGEVEGAEEEEFAKALDGVSALVRAAGNARDIEIVKIEDDEEEVGAMLLNSTGPSSLALAGLAPSNTNAPDYHNRWTKSLTASYLSSTIDARHDIASSIIFLLMLLKFKGHEWMDNISAIVLDELFAGLRSTCILRGTAGRVMECESQKWKPPVTATADESGNVANNQLTVVRRAGTADSISARMGGLVVRPMPGGIRLDQDQDPKSPTTMVKFSHTTNVSPNIPVILPTVRGSGSVPLLQTTLGPLRRPFSLPYASDSWLLDNGIITSDSMLISSPDEVKFAEMLRRKADQTRKGLVLGSGQACFDAAAEVVDWLPKGPACCYVAGKLRIMKGDYDEAADLFERSGRSFGEQTGSVL